MDKNEEVQTGDQTQPQDATGGGEQPAQPGERTFTQAELEAIIGDRLVRERQKYSDYAELKEAKAKLDEIEQQNLSELEKAQKRAEDAEAERETALAEALETRLMAEFVKVGAAKGVANPEDAYLLDDSGLVEIADDGKITGVAEALDALISAGRLVLTERPKAPALDGGAGGGERPGERVTLSAEEATFADKMGVSHEDYLKAKQMPRTGLKPVSTEKTK